MTTTSRTVSTLGVLLLVAGVGWWFLADQRPRMAGSSDGDEKPRVAAPKTAADDTQEKRAAIADRSSADASAAGAKSGAPATTGSLTVKVLFGTDRAPGPDVGVALRNHGNYDWPRRLRQRTDADGVARFADLPPGKVWIRSDRRSHEYERATIVAGEHSEVEIHLTDGVDVRGVVVDDQGFPVAKATLLLTGWASADARVVGYTDDSGRFEQRQLGSLHSLGARAKGYAPSPMHRCAGKDGAKIELRIVMPGRGGGLHGVVRGPDGAAIPNLAVRYGDAQAGRVMTLPNGARGVAPRNAEAFTDAKGAFSMSGLAPGTQTLVVNDERFVPYAVKTEVFAGASTEVQVQLREGVTVRGVVTETSGEPAAKIQLSMVDQPGSRVPRYTQTAADGSYRLTGLPVGEIQLRIRDQKRGGAKATLHGQAGDVLEWSPELSLGHVIRGVVRGKNGAPVHRARVQAMELDSSKKRPWFWFGSTNEAGEFVLTGVPEKAKVRLSIERREYDSFVREVTIADSPLQVQLKWEGPPTARIIGTILDPDGKPVDNASISVWREEGDGGRVYTAKPGGKIEIDKQRAGTYSLSIQSSVYPRHRTEKRKIANGETLDYGNVQLVRGGRVRVTLTSNGPIPKKGIYLSLYTLAGKHAARVDLDKPEPISDPAPVGEYELRLAGPSVLPVAVRVEVDGATRAHAKVPVRLGVPRMFELTAPEACREVALTVTGPGGFRWRQTLRRTRTAPFTYSFGCPAGKLRAVAVSPEGHRAEFDFEVEAGEKESKRVRATLR